MGKINGKNGLGKRVPRVEEADVYKTPTKARVRSLLRKPKETSWRKKVQVAKAAGKVTDRRDNMRFPITAEDVAVMRRIVDIFVGKKELPFVGVDSARIKTLINRHVEEIRKIKWANGGRRKSGFDESSVEGGWIEGTWTIETRMLLWLRRLLVADLYAQGVGVSIIAETLGINDNCVQIDLRSLAECQLLSQSLEETQLSITKHLVRFEVLQQQAFKNLNDLSEFETLAVSGELRAIREEISNRELIRFRILSDLGIYTTPSGGAVGRGGNINIFNLPAPTKSLQDMTREERYTYMQQAMAAVQQQVRAEGPAGGEEAEYAEVESGREEDDR